MKKTILVPVIIGILALVIGFFGGTFYQKSKTPTRQAGAFQMGANGTRTANGTGTARTGTGITGANTRGGAPVSGKITAMDSTSITVQSADGSSKIVLLSDQTKINKTSQGAVSDLSVGTQVMVIGSTASGAVTAQSITLGGVAPSQSASTPSAPTK